MLLLLAAVEGAREVPTYTVTRCMSQGGAVEVKCPQPNEKIRIKSVGYSYIPDGRDCNVAIEDNDCTQFRCVYNYYIYNDSVHGISILASSQLLH